MSMGILTKNEREGLEEVFLSINSGKSRFEKLKYFISLLLHIHTDEYSQKEQKIAKTGNFRDKLTKNFTFFSKVKKNLSK